MTGFNRKHASEDEMLAIYSACKQEAVAEVASRFNRPVSAVRRLNREMAAVEAITAPLLKMITRH